MALSIKGSRAETMVTGGAFVALVKVVTSKSCTDRGNISR